MNLSHRKHLWKIVGPLLIGLAACGGEPDPGAATSEPQAAESAETAEAPSPAAQPPAAQQSRLNLNTATEEEFRTIPEVGDRMVHEFFEYRPYVSIQQFRQEIGKYVSEEQVAAYEQYVYVPVDPNESDAETLQQLPGVDADEAAELTAGRPYASPEAFLEALTGYVSDAERTEAEHYLQAP